MSSRWSGTSFPATGAQASVSQAAPNVGGVSTVNRIRSLLVSVAGDGTLPTGIVHIVIRNGASGVGSIVWNGVVQAAATGSVSLAATDLDIRSGAGNAITLESTGGGAGNSQLAISVQGDIVPEGYPGYAVPSGGF